VKLNDKQKEEYDKLATKMDARDEFMMLLKDYFAKHGKPPEQYKTEWDIFRKEGFKSWRAMPKVRKRIIKAAKKASKI